MYFWSSRFKKGESKLKKVQGRNTRMTKGVDSPSHETTRAYLVKSIKTKAEGG